MPVQSVPMWRTFFKSGLLIASLVGIGFAAQYLGLSHLDEGWIDAHIRGQGLAGSLLFIALGAAATGVGFPRQVIAFLGGYAFGLAWGVSLALWATVLGCIGAFYYARFFARDLLAQRFAARLGRFDAFLGQHPLSMTLVIRLLPVGSNALTNLLAGLTRIPALPFFAGSGLGYIPQTLIFALAGSGVHFDPLWRLSIATVLFVFSSYLGYVLYQRYRHDIQPESVLSRNDSPAAEP